MFSLCSVPGLNIFHVYIICTSVQVTQNLFILVIMHYSNIWIYNISFGRCFNVFIHQHGKKHPNEHSTVLFHINSGDVHNLICGPYVSHIWIRIEGFPDIHNFILNYNYVYTFCFCEWRVSILLKQNLKKCGRYFWWTYVISWIQVLYICRDDIVFLVYQFAWIVHLK